MVFCPECGSPVEPGQLFCDNCGSPQEAAPPAPSPPQVAPAFSPPGSLPIPPPALPVPPAAAGFAFTPQVIAGSIASIILIALIIFFVLPGGSSSAQPASGAGVTGGSGLPVPGTMTQCPASLFLCNGYCVDLRTDTGNCGACGVLVPPGKRCENGQLVPGSGSAAASGFTSPSLTTQPVITSASPCPTGQDPCNGACRNLQSDTGNCGACGVTCPQGQSCQYGRCAPPATLVTTVPLPADLPCQKGESRCSGICKNLMTDPANCAVCGRTCRTGEICQNGQCGPLCMAGMTDCSGVCFNLKTDLKNCGACGTVCPPVPPNSKGSLCLNGHCSVFQCNAGYADCDQNIVNGCEVKPATDKNNCGSCGVRCPSPQSCINGYCLIPK